VEYSCLKYRNILGKVKKPFTKHAQPLGLMRASRCLSDEAADNFCGEPSPFIPLMEGDRGEDTVRRKNCPITKYGRHIAGL